MPLALLFASAHLCPCCFQPRHQPGLLPVPRGPWIPEFPRFFSSCIGPSELKMITEDTGKNAEEVGNFLLAGLATFAPVGKTEVS